MAQKRLPEYTGPLVVKCFTFMKNVTGQTLSVCGMSPGRNVIGVGTDVVLEKMYVWLVSAYKCSICDLKTQRRTVQTNTVRFTGLFAQLYTYTSSRCFSHNIIKNYST